ncbi:cob(I)yrinic acid a,c-diamide adenosyltransferase [Olivibacter sp. SDN3]|uniref:cob(I)yrinic acid a,c-diamide adenosyltransferase n=1 Tax=Olivibacter sp. SDN3 TaxID=2764720 RepID=UPI00165195D0|nr:cob(I)yrinic acid a,c-diamide adenosyltransferase [Olivibacter sp. SDN3]QNL48684.1 cob(I)yrinic acid a,c-diamide adenosyltransferase [Olivibacter sp. SDN3]
MKIYTKTGDKGQTSLIGGTRVSKYHERVGAYGTLDELNSYIGLIRSYDIDLRSKEELIAIQQLLFAISALLAADPEKSKMKLYTILDSDIEYLEKAVDFMDKQLKPLKNFILPGGNIVVSHIHIARCICRRAERLVVRVAENSNVQELIIVYLNRLSDYLFVLARKVAQDTNCEEVAWYPREQ